MTRQLASVIRSVIFCVVAVALPLAAVAQDAAESKVGGLPVGIVKEALTHPNAARRQKLFALVKQRIVRDPVARQRFLNADTTAAAARLARFSHSVQMLSAARNETTDSALQAKLDEVIAAIAAASSSSQ
jgi:hypothetical protein